MDEGSSPLARGTQDGPPPGPCRAGLIPARAGNTCCLELIMHLSWAHPRSRGEHVISGYGSSNPEGSSPLARGTHHAAKVNDGIKGLIPARAGNTLPPRLMKRSMRAHPRSRGEHLVGMVLAVIIGGSSPLARGTLGVLRCERRATGLIPARAGNTTRLVPVDTTIRAHPRSRGEHQNCTRYFREW